MLSPGEVVLSVFLFIGAGFLEVGGGWLVWQAVREDRPWWWGLIGALLLVAYGVVPCYQPEDGNDSGTSHFARVYAIYGGYFIALALLWGWAVDKRRPDIGDTLGAAIAIAGALIMFFWPRKKATGE
ncbi:hypothetical protein JKP88DRAFT_286760 [Tribonema minus]|uniref:Uncharacterized protein n=1 Tax=Tribonema minus TaxID=303371 RepID=A0A836CJY5_9STRA|nr:hypothetical protein JKP88DRAFT_286760 [Tribonema minus]